MSLRPDEIVVGHVYSSGCFTPRKVTKIGEALLRYEDTHTRENFFAKC